MAPSGKSTGLKYGMSKFAPRNKNQIPIRISIMGNHLLKLNFNLDFKKFPNKDTKVIIGKVPNPKNTINSAAFSIEFAFSAEAKAI